MAWCFFEAFSKRAFALSIIIVFLLDFLACFLVFTFGQESDQEKHDTDRYASATLDSLVCCVLRLLLFPLLSAVALIVYRREAANSPIVRLQRQEEASSCQRAAPSGGVSDDLRIPLANTQSAATTCTTASQQSVFEMKRDHALHMKQAARRRDLVMAFTFAISTAMSSYNGIKCVAFHYDPSLQMLQGALISSVMFFINLEYFMMRDLVTKLTAETGELIPHMHMHPLFFETGLKCHQCDVCHEAMKTPHYIAYRCRTCDFDLCPRCYKQKDKPTAKGFGARSIRRDGEQITSWTYFTRILGLAMEFKTTVVFALFFLVITQCLQIWAPSIQGNIFDGIIHFLKDQDGPGKAEFEKAIIMYLCLNVLQGAFSGLKALNQELVTRRIACTVRTKLFTSVMRLDISFFDAMHTGQLTSRLTNDASQMVAPLSTLMNDLIANVILLFGGTFMAFRTSWKLSLLALTIVPPITYSFNVYAEWARKVNRSIYCAYGEANTTATDAITNIRTVRGFSTEEHETFKYQDSINEAMRHAVKNAYVSGTVTAFSTYMNLGTAVLILWYGGTLVCDSGSTTMTIGELITFQLYWNMMNSAFISLSNVYNDLIRSSSAAERVFSLIDARPDVNPDDGEIITREAVHGHLEIRAVQFRYRTRPENAVLKGVNLDMAPGTTTALVGKSGGGKSTLVHLLMRFYEPTEGAILLDGKDMRNLSSKSVRQCCGFVAQDTQLFACSIEENLSYGLGREHTKEELHEACKAANAHEFIMDMEEGYETRAGEKGVMLSGGQRQRLAVARCFLRRPKLLFLDEATSALDAENESLVQAALDKLVLTLGSTAVLIAHRLSTVINATQIAVVHKGAIIERGPHDDLIKVGGIYAQLVQRQMSRDATSVLDEKKAASKAGPKKGTEIDELIEEMEQSGQLDTNGK